MIFLKVLVITSPIRVFLHVLCLSSRSSFSQFSKWCNEITMLRNKMDWLGGWNPQ